MKIKYFEQDVGEQNSYKSIEFCCKKMANFFKNKGGIMNYCPFCGKKIERTFTIIVPGVKTNGQIKKALRDEPEK